MQPDQQPALEHDQARRQRFDYWWQRLDAMNFNTTDNRSVIASEICDLEDEVARLKQGWRDAFDAIDKSAGSSAKHFTKYPCSCGRQISNAGWAARSHLRSKAHRDGMEALGALPDEAREA